MRRVVITGIGIVSSIGNTVEEFKVSLMNGSSGIRIISEDRMDTSNKVYRNRQACTIADITFNDIYDHDDTVLSGASIASIRQALVDAGLDIDQLDRRDIGLCLGTSVASNFPFLKWVREYMVDSSAILQLKTPATIAGRIAKEFGLRGPISTISTACAAGTNSIGRAADLIRKGRVNCMITGGVDIFTDHTLSGFNSLQAISRSLCMPFDQSRDGLILGDASAYFILEDLEHARSRGAKIYAEIMGYSTLNEAYHPTAPKPDGSTALRVMREAIAYSGLVPADVEYINAHGTATKANDEMELKAIEQFAEGRKIFVSSTKSMVGHTLGAAGSIELLATLIGMCHDFIPPTINMVSGMNGANENIIFVRDRSMEKGFSIALSNSFGFAGNMAAIVIRKFNNN